MRVRREYITLRTRQRVAERARHTCEYCRHRDDYIYDSFEIEHIIPLAHPLSSNALRNLAYACGGCNGFKGAKTHATDPATGEEVPLYNPRQQRWSDHFAWTPDYTQMIGLTPTGRATVDALRLNRVGLQNLRRSLHRDGQHTRRARILASAHRTAYHWAPRYGKVGELWRYDHPDRRA